MTKYVSDTSAAKSVSAWIILNRKGQHVATVKAHYGNSRVLVNVHCDKGGFQHATASGYGYDKFTAALSRLSIDGHKMTDHCEARLKPPRGLPCFPSDYKPRKGYSLANYGTWDRATGKRLDSYHWRDLALTRWREETGAGESDWPDNPATINNAARCLAADADARGETISGYGSCFRDAGLKYLQAIGYRVIQAI